MTYYESAKGIWISKERAIVEIRKHGNCEREFFKDCGERDRYRAQDVLGWLGY